MPVGSGYALAVCLGIFSTCLPISIDAGHDLGGSSGVKKLPVGHGPSPVQLGKFVPAASNRGTQASGLVGNCLGELHYLRPVTAPEHARMPGYRYLLRPSWAQHYMCYML